MFELIKTILGLGLLIVILYLVVSLLLPFIISIYNMYPFYFHIGLVIVGILIIINVVAKAQIGG